jgi:RNA polymerase-binding transcription factor DksA
MDICNDLPELDASFLDRQRRVLSRAHVAEERRLSAIQANLGAGENTSYTQGASERGELAKLLVDRVNGGSFEEAIKLRIAKIEAAIERLDDCSYGWCIRCHEVIERERLEALPETDLCATCKSSRGALPSFGAN